MCEIIDHVHTYDEYLVLLAKSGMTSSFLHIFYFRIPQSFENSNSNRSVFTEPTKSNQVGFVDIHENRSVFNAFSIEKSSPRPITWGARSHDPRHVNPGCPDHGGAWRRGERRDAR
jgi:hypothetical protein